MTEFFSGARPSPAIMGTGRWKRYKGIVVIHGERRKLKQIPQGRA